MPKANTCMVCGAYSHSVPMTQRTYGERDLYLCDDATWCQARAGANAVEAMGLAATVLDGAS